MKHDLTNDLADRLVTACWEFPYHHTAAISCGITYSLLKHWLILGLTEPNEPYCSFAERYYAADLRLAKETFERIRIEENPGILKALQEWSAKRWPAAPEEASILHLTEAKPVKRRGLVYQLKNPTPEMAQCIAEAGLVQQPALEAQGVARPGTDS